MTNPAERRHARTSLRSRECGPAAETIGDAFSLRFWLRFGSRWTNEEDAGFESGSGPDIAGAFLSSNCHPL
jgi:hypothetical protein